MLKLFKYLKSFRIPIAIIIAFVFVRTLTDLYLPTLMAEIVDEGIVQADTDFIIRIGGLMLAVALLGGVCSIVAGYFSSRVGMGFGRELRNRLFTKVTNFSLHEIDEVGTASLITRTTNDIVQVQNVMIMLLRIATMAPLMAIGSIVMALNKDVKLSYIIVVAVIIMGVMIGIIASNALPLFKIMQVKVDGINLVMRERLTGLRVIRAFNRIDTEEKRFNKANRELTDVAIKVNKLMAIMMPFMTLVFSLSSVAIIWFGAHRVDTGAIEVGDMMAFIQYATQILMSILMLTMIFVMVPRASASAVRINDVLLTEPEIDNPAQPKSISKKGTVEFDQVSFYYHSDHGAKEPAISDISFKAKPGEVTAIIGGTGSGKSTLINMIPRYYDVSEGRVLVDGVDIRELDMHELRSEIGLVPQKAVLFTGTIEDNIRFGKKEATDNEVKEAARIAQATEFIDQMPEGYQSVIAQGGNNVSGGQKQRLSIARAIVRRPKIYLFDDSFSALDFKTEAKLRQELLREAKDATVLLVAQKVTSVMNADQILVLDQGKCVGQGTHDDLIESCPVYQEIVASQLSKEELENGR